MLPKRHWADMSWADFGDADVGRWIAVLPLAATEQHGLHLPVGVDAYIADACLARAGALLPPELPVTILPTQRIGLSDEHLGFPGTLSLSAATALRAWTEIGEGVHRAGVRKLVLITSHGGNVEAMGLVARDLRARLGMFVVTVAWHRFGDPDGLFDADERRHGIHAGDIETSVMLFAAPQTVRMERAVANAPASVAMEREFKYLAADRPAGFGWMSQDLDPSGTIGDPTTATAAKGQAVVEHAAAAFVELLHEVDRFDLARLKPGPLSTAK
jgi:creatinine amidohydrolase